MTLNFTGMQRCETGMVELTTVSYGANFVIRKLCFWIDVSDNSSSLILSIRLESEACCLYYYLMYTPFRVPDL